MLILVSNFSNIYPKTCPFPLADMEIPTRPEGRGFNAPFVPSSPMEIFLAALLCLVSVIVVAYTMVVLYRCICSRNYAEWRASWHQQEKSSDSATQLVMEAVPLVLEGHTQEVECIATDGNTIASACLAGHIRVWDSISGEELTHIDRQQFFGSSVKDLSQQILDPDELMSDYESGSPPSRGEMEVSNSFGLYSNLGGTGIQMRKRRDCASSYENVKLCPGSSLDYDFQINECSPEKQTVRMNRRSVDSSFEFPDLRSSINTNFSNVKYSPVQKNYEQGFDFGDQYKQLFEEHRKSIDEIQNSENVERLTSTSLNRLNKNELNGSVTSLGTDRTVQITSQNAPPIWCIDYQENLIVVGCANGTLEFWEGTTGLLKVSIKIVLKKTKKRKKVNPPIFQLFTVFIRRWFRPWNISDKIHR